MATKLSKRLSIAQVSTDAERLFHGIRWNLGIVVCPYCGSIHIKEYDGYRYKCNSCKNRFSDRTNTLMHGSKLSIQTWMIGIYLMFTDNFISSISLAEKLGINQKSAWLMKMKVDYSLPQDRWLLNGVIAQDEMYIGGSLSNYHYSRKLDLLRAKGLLEQDRRDYTKNAIYALNSDLKQPVFGMNDGNKVVLYATPNPIKSSYIKHIYNKHAQEGSVVVSDESGLYNDWEGELHTNNHHNNQYMTKEGLTSNRIENTFSWYKRGFGGKITHCKYHQFYLNEFAFRYNTRGLSTEERFKEALSSGIGHTVTYKDIKAYNQFGMFDIKKNNRRHIFTKAEIEDMFRKMSSLKELIIGKTVYKRKDFLGY